MWRSSSASTKRLSQYGCGLACGRCCAILCGKRAEGGAEGPRPSGLVSSGAIIVREHPAATKRALRALFKANETYALEPEAAAQLMVNRGDTAATTWR